MVDTQYYIGFKYINIVAQQLHTLLHPHPHLCSYDLSIWEDVTKTLTISSMLYFHSHNQPILRLRIFVLFYPLQPPHPPTPTPSQW